MQHQTDIKSLFSVLMTQKKEDYLVQPQAMTMTTGNRLRIPTHTGFQEFPITDTGHQAVANTTKIPVRYYRKMLDEAPELLQRNANHWFSEGFDDDTRKMVRVLDGEARAIMSDRYQRIDNIGLVNTVVKLAQKYPEIQFIDCGLSPESMRIKLLFPERREVKVGDVIQAGIMISNSEIGRMSVRIDGLTWRLWCGNGARAMARTRRAHLGAAYDEHENYLSESTKRMSDAAIAMQMHDTVIGMLEDTSWFDKEINKMKEATEQPVLRAAEELPQRINSVISLSDEEIAKFLMGLSHQMTSNDISLVDPLNTPPTRYDVGNTMTWLAQKAENYERRIELEQVGGEIFSQNSVWNKIR